MMSLSPSDILERMDKLKRWQEEQERLMLQHHKRLNENVFLDASPEYCESRTIFSHFQELETPSMSKPKQPFLRRGSGLSRFKMAPGEQFKALSKGKGRRSIETPEVKHIFTKPLEQRAVWNNVSTSTEPNASLLMFEELEKKLKDNSICIKAGMPSSTPAKKQLFADDSSYAWQFSQPRHVAEQDVAGSTHTSYEQEVSPLHFTLEPLSTSNETYDDLKEKNEEVMQINKKQMEEFEQIEKRLQAELLTSLEDAIKLKRFIKQDKAVGSCSPISSISNGLATPTEAIQDFDDIRKWSSNVSLASTSSTVSSSQVMNVPVKCDAATMTEDVFQPERNLKEVEELQKCLKQELKTAQSQNNETKHLRTQLEAELRSINIQKKNMLKEAQEDKNNLERANASLDEGRKKLVKEKMVFEKYVKDLQNKPNKKEREEITHLKEELSTLKETYKLKEVKTSTSQARLRNQLKHLEKENSDLKLEVEKLLKENGKLVASQRLSKKPSDTKLLHEINKNITKLAQDQLSKISEKPQHGKEKENNKNVSNSSDFDANSSVTKVNTADLCTSYYNDQSIETSRNSDGGRVSNCTEEVMPDGSRRITYSNGRIKNISVDGNIIKIQYPNGDTKVTNLLDGTICYFSIENKIRHITSADGVETFEYSDGRIETRFTDGTTQVKFPNKIIVLLDSQGEKTLILPNGQKEIHTKDHKRREYPDGTVKLLYPDGRQETRYSNGRVRIKDNEGILVFDSEDQQLTI